MKRESSSRSPSPFDTSEHGSVYEDNRQGEVASATSASGRDATGTQSPASSDGGSDDADNNTYPLADDFAPGDDDVICGRGKKCYSHIGNERFRHRVIAMLNEYSRAKSKLDKSSVLSRVVDQVRQQSPSGGFVKQDPTTGKWFEVGDFLAREKTSQAFRDALHERYKSSNLSKKKRRQEEQAKASDIFNRIARSEYDISSRVERLQHDFLVGQHQMPGQSRFGGQSKYEMARLNRIANMNLPNDVDRFVASPVQSFRPVHRPESNQQTSTYTHTHVGHRQGYHNFPDPLFGSTSNVPNLMAGEASMARLSRGNTPPFHPMLHARTSDPGPINSHQTQVARADEYNRLYRSLPEFLIDDSSQSIFSTDPFQDREQFERLYESLPNMPFPPYSTQQQQHQQQQQLRSHYESSHRLHEDKIPVNIGASIHQQDILLMDERKPAAVDFDPIPFQQVKLPSAAPHTKKYPSSDVTELKKSPSTGSNKDYNSSGTSSSASGRLSKDLLECLGKLTDHTISDENPFEPIPMAVDRIRRQSSSDQDDLLHDDSIEFGEA